jgi:hypothetical protein
MFEPKKSRSRQNGWAILRLPASIDHDVHAPWNHPSSIIYRMNQSNAKRQEQRNNPTNTHSTHTSSDMKNQILALN